MTKMVMTLAVTFTRVGGEKEGVNVMTLKQKL